MGFAVFEDADAADQTVASKEAGPRPAVKIGVPNNGLAEISKPVRSSSPAPCRQTANKEIVSLLHSLAPFRLSLLVLQCYVSGWLLRHLILSLIPDAHRVVVSGS